VTYRNTFLYDVTYGGIISSEGWLDFDGGRDFFNGLYNDHHFHNGYFIYAAAVILHFDPSWPYAHVVLDLVRDVANPSQLDSYFPITRNKDWFVGHSWAQGINFRQDPFSGTNQESTSESMNCYYAIHLFGLATNNKDLSNFGQLLMLTELRSAKLYWHMTPDSRIYRQPFVKNAAVGVLWSGMAHYAAFFGGGIEHIHCVQMLPFTPFSAHYMTRDWVQYDYSVLSTALSKPNLKEEWRAYIYQAWAVFDREAAWDKAFKLKDAAFAGGNSFSNLLWWIASRPL